MTTPAREWQPIETAPKDGTVILVALIKDGHVMRVSDARHVKDLGLYTRFGGEACHWRTHWMPLPDPPEAERDRREAEQK